MTLVSGHILAVAGAAAVLAAVPAAAVVVPVVSPLPAAESIVLLRNHQKVMAIHKREVPDLLLRW